MTKIKLTSETQLPDPLAEALDPRAIIRETIGNIIDAGKVPNWKNVLWEAARVLHQRNRGYKSEDEAYAEIKRAAQAMSDDGELEANQTGPWRLLR